MRFPRHIDAGETHNPIPGDLVFDGWVDAKLVEFGDLSFKIDLVLRDRASGETLAVPE
jgi:hypothetical protein